MNKMKRIILSAIILMSMLSSCYDDFRLDHDFTGVAFGTANGGSNVVGVLHRSVVKDEGLKLDVGINLTGVLENRKERWADFEIDPSLLQEERIAALGYKLMPQSYYTLSGNRFIIPSGSHLGKITVTLDSAKFVNDPDAVKHVYAIPFRMVSTSEDSINANLSTKIVVIKYINHYEGFYDQTGKADYFDYNGAAAGSQQFTNVLTVNTIMLDTVYADGMMNMTGVNYRMKMVVNSDNSVFIKELLNPAIGLLSRYEAVYTEALTWTSFDAAGKQLKTGTTTVNNTFTTVENDKVLVNNKMKSWTATSKTKKTTYSYNLKVNANNTLEFLDYVADSLGTKLEPVGTNSYNPATRAFQLNYKIVFPNGAYELISATYSWKNKNRDKQFITATGENKYDPETSTFTLNYKMQSFFGDYYNISTKLVWRNRIRDGINEWRR